MMDYKLRYISANFQSGEKLWLIRKVVTDNVVFTLTKRSTFAAFAIEQSEAFQLVRRATISRFTSTFADFRQKASELAGENEYVKLSIEDEAGKELASMSFVPNPLKAG